MLCFLDFLDIPFFIREKSTFYRTVYFQNLINIFGSKSRTRQQNSRFLFSSFSIFCVNFLCNDILLMNKTFRPSIFGVLLQLKDLK